MPILPNNDLDYIDEESEDITSEDMTDGSSVTENNATYNDPFDYNGPADIGVPDSLPVDPVVPESSEDRYYVTYYNRGDLTDYEPAYLQELAEAGCKFYAIYDDETEVEIQWTEIEDLDPLETEIDISASIAAATNQHFWDDTNGVHVSEVSKEDWQTALEAEFSDLSSSKNYYNILMNSLGLLLRRANFILTSINRASISFYDGLGNETTNIMASFGRNSAQIGRSNDKHVVINNSGLTAYNSDGTLAPLTGTFDGANINNSSITNAKIVDGTIEGTKIASATIDNSNIKNGTITGAKIADGTIENADIKNGTIEGTKIASATIDNSNIKNGTIEGTKIASATIDNSNIKNGTITGAKIADGTIENTDIKNGTITGSKIASATIENSNIKDGTIQGTKIVGSTLTGIPYAGIADADIEVARVANTEIAKAEVNYAHITNGVIDNAKIDKADVNGLAATYATITNLNAATARIGSLEAADVTINGRLDAAEADIDDLEAEDARIGNLVAQKASITDLNAATARIGSLEAADVTINGRIDATEADIDDLEAEDARIGNLVAQKASITDLNAATARIGDLEADHVSVEDFEAEQANIDTLQANTADIATIRANSAKVQNLTAAQLEADHATVGSLSTTYATITNLNAANGRISDLESTRVRTTDLEANYITADTIEANYTKTDLSNTDVAWIQNGTIKDGAISNAMIGSLSASKLTAGTINGNTITVTNLNADNITAGTLNGQRIGEGSLSLSKLEEDVYTESEVDSIVSNLQTQIDGAIETWTGTAVPTLNNSPASGWTTNAIKDTHVGDVYFVVNSNSQQNGYNYRFTKSGSTYSWQLIKDSDVTNALQRLSTAEGKITTFDSDISQLKTDTGTLTTKTTSLETRMSNAESDILDKVDTITFNEVSDTVDSHSQSITQMSTTLSNKADSSTVTAVTNRVSKTEQDISGINTTIGTMQTTLASKADGSTVETMSTKLNTVSDTVDGHTQSLQSVTSTQTTIQQNAVKSTIQLWFTKANTTAPAKPTAHVTSGSTGANTWTTNVPAYNSGYPNYYYCYEYQYLDGSYGWSAVTRDIAMGETQERARTAITNAANAQADIDELEIGGRNLLLETGTIFKQTYYDTYNIRSSTSARELGAGTTLTIQFWDVELDANSSGIGGYWGGDSSGQLFNIKPDASGYCSKTFTISETTASHAQGANKCLCLYNLYSGHSGTSLSIGRWKLEKGNRATDWTPAPEDVDADISTAQTSADNAQATADKNVKESVQLWFTKANGSAPNKPTSAVTSTSTSGNAWTTKVPTYSASYPHYFYCMQYKLADGTYTWSDVVYDQATTEAQSVARTTSTNLSTLQQDYATFKQTTQNFESTIGTTYATKTEVSAVDDKIDNLEIGGRNLLYLTKPFIGKTGESANGYLTKYSTFDVRVPIVSETYKGLTVRHFITSSVDTSLYYDLNYNSLLIPITGKAYVFSFYAKGSGKIRSHFYPMNSGGSIKNIGSQGQNNTNSDGNIDFIVSSDWKRYWVRYEIGGSQATTARSLLLRSYGGNDIYVCGLKFEEGYNSTDWTPAPEDVDASIAAIPRMSKINMASRNFTTNQWKTYGSRDHVENWTTGASYNNSHLRVGDRAYMVGTISDQNGGTATIIGEITNVQPAGSGTSYVTLKSEQLIFGGDVVSAIESRVSSAETSITQTNQQIALKANASDVYTKTQTDGLISTEVSNRNSAIEQSAAAINLSVSQNYTTKTESKQLIQPNLTPFFAQSKSSTVYWKNSNATVPAVTSDWSFEQDGPDGLGGWAHLSVNNTSGKVVYAMAYVDKDALRLKASTKYTFLLEWANVTISGSSNFYATSEHGGTGGSNNDFFSSTAMYPITSGSDTKYYAATTRAELETNCNNRIRAMISIGNGTSIEGYFRLSVYEGDYTGLYKPYIGTQLYPTETEFNEAKAEIKVTTDGITSTVEKINSAKYLASSNSGWSLASIKSYASYNTQTTFQVTSTNDARVGDTVYIKGTDTTRNCTIYIKGVVKTVNSATSITIYGRGYEDILPVESIKSTINQSSDAVKIQAKHIEIDGAAIFSNSDFKAAADAAYDAKGSANTAKSEAISAAATDATNKANAVQTNLDNLEIGGRNLVRGTSGDWSEWYTPTPNGANQSSAPDHIAYFPLDSKEGDFFTASLEVEFSGVTAGSGTFAWRIQGPTDNVWTNKWNPWRNIIVLSPPSDGVYRFSVTNEATSAIEDEVSFKCGARADYWGSGKWRWRRVKVERGTKATDWTPAPEDVDASIASVATTANNAAPKTSAVAEEQYIYRSATSGTTSMAGTTTWVTAPTSVTASTQNAWTTKRPEYSSSYPVLFIAKQRKTVDGTVTCTTPVKDDTTTIIDGGHITTGTIDANRISTTVINAINANVSDTINANKINASSLTIGYSQLTNPPTIPSKVSDLTNDSNYQTSQQVTSAINAIEIGGRNLLRNSLAMNLGSSSWTNGVWRVAGNADMSKSRVVISDGPLGQCYGLQLVGTQSTTSDASCYGIDSMPRDIGEDYIISMFARVVGGGIAQAGFALNSANIEDTNTDGRWAGYYTKTLEANGKWTRIWVHWKSTASSGNIYIGGAATDSSSKTIQMCLVKIEKGTKPTDWTPAPEDVSADISAAESSAKEYADTKKTEAIAASYANMGFKYKKDIVIYGESSKYYPVYLNNNQTEYSQASPHEIVITRGYSEQAPSDWNTATHKGSLNLRLRWNYGGWGGATYICQIYDFSEMYSTMLGDVLVGNKSGMNSTIYLRGGGTTGAIYHIYSEVAIDSTRYDATFPYIGTNTGDTYMTSGSYTWKVDNPLTTPNRSHILSLAAVVEEQYIYRSAASGTNSMAVNETWVTANGEAQNVWTTKRPVYDSSYPVLFVAKQRKLAFGLVTCTTPVKDDTTTIIDGGHITTGTIDTNRLNADTIKSNIVQTTNLDASKITAGDISADRIKTNVVSAIQAVVTDLQALVAKIGGFTLDATSIRTAALTSNADNSIGLSTADFTRTINGTSRAGLRMAFGDKFGVTGDGAIFASSANVSGTITATAGTIGGASISNGVLKVKDANIDGTISGSHIDASSISIGSLNGVGDYVTKTDAQGYANAKDDAIAAAAKRTDVAVAVTAIDYDLGTATLQATLYIDGTAATSNVTYKWLKDGSIISGQTARTLSVTAAMGLSHVYSCTVTYS